MLLDIPLFLEKMSLFACKDISDPAAVPAFDQPEGVLSVLHLLTIYALQVDSVDPHLGESTTVFIVSHFLLMRVSRCY